MRHRTIAISNETPNTVFDTAVEILMALLLIFAPLAFGSTEFWSQQVCFIIVWAMALCVPLKLLFFRQSAPAAWFIWSWIYIPIALFILLVVFQVLPLPKGLVSIISPGTIETKSALLAGAPGADDVLEKPTITFYSQATLAQLWLLLSVAALFVVVLHFYRDPQRIRRLLLTIAMVGLGVSLLACYQNLSGTKTIYGTTPMIHRNSGPFMNYSHFGQFMNMSVGAALALLLVKIADLQAKAHRTERIIEAVTNSRSAMLWLLAATCVIGPVTVFLAMTRMGMISLMTAGALVAALMIWRLRKASLVMMIGILIFGALICVGFDAVYDRLATVRNIERVDGGRLQMLRDMSVMFRQFPLLGTGLGTHEYVFPMYDHSDVPQLATHAENEYAQLMEEAGLVGVVLAAIFIGFIAFQAFRTVWNPKDPLQYAGFGLIFGLIAILLHSASDFGQHVPANAFLTAIFTALLANLAYMARKRNDAVAFSPQRGPAFTWMLGLTGSAAVGAIAVAVLLPVDRARSAETHWNQAVAAQKYFEIKDWAGTGDQFLSLLRPATATVELQPGNVKYNHWLNVYRWRSISSLREPETNEMVLSDTNLSFVPRIVDELHAARLLCPTYGPPLCVAGQLEKFVLERPEGSKHIQTALQLSRYDSTVCSVAGASAAYDQDWDASLAAFRRGLALGGSPREAIDAYVSAGKPDLAYEFAAGRRDSLSYLAQRVQSNADHAILAKKCQDEALGLLTTAAQQPDAWAGTLAEFAGVCAATGKPVEAVELYRRALALEYGQVGWRLQLARVLAASGQPEEAMREARQCLTLRPQYQEARDLIASLTGRRDGTPSDAASRLEEPARTAGQ